MRNRILDFSRQGGYLKLHLDNLVVERQGEEIARIPVEDIAVLILDHPALVITQGLLASLLENNVVQVICGPNKMPVGMTMPFQANHIHTERFQHQVRATKPLRKRLWKQIITVKIRMQGKALVQVCGGDFNLIELSKHVTSGDSKNMESRAARLYWSNLFGHNSFRRDVDGTDQNRLLNYGYAVLRSVVARALCAAGLHLALGLHHHNRYNAFVLADDIMEPFRPLVDMTVVRCVEQYGPECPLSPEIKTEIIGSILARYSFSGENRTLFDWLGRVASSLVAVFEGKQPKMFIPELLCNNEQRDAFSV